MKYDHNANDADGDTLIRNHWEMLPERLREMLIMAGFEQGKRNDSS